MTGEYASACAAALCVLLVQLPAARVASETIVVREGNA